MIKASIRLAGSKTSEAVNYRRYVESGTWRCPKGGAHKWVEVVAGTGVYRCGKCKHTREFRTPEIAFTGPDSCGGGAIFGVHGVFDAMQRGYV